MLVQFSERVAINDDDNVALSAELRSNNATKEAVLVITSSGPVEIATVGDSAPGGGTFSGFGPWPSLGPGDMVAFIAGVDGGPGPLGLYAGQSRATSDASPWSASTWPMARSYRVSHSTQSRPRDRMAA